MKKLIVQITSLFILMGMVFSVYFFNEKHDARAEELKMVELRLDQKVEGDKYFKLQERIWQLEDRQEKESIPERSKEIRELKEQLGMQSDVIKQIQRSIEEKR